MSVVDSFIYIKWLASLVFLHDSFLNRAALPFHGCVTTVSDVESKLLGVLKKTEYKSFF